MHVHYSEAIVDVCIAVCTNAHTCWKVILHMCMHGLYLQQLRREKAALRQNNLASRCADAGGNQYR